MPAAWNRSRAAALAATLLLHAAAAGWLLRLRTQAPTPGLPSPGLIWVPVPVTAPLPPPPSSPPAVVPARLPERTPAVGLPAEEPESSAVTLPDWGAEARAVASQFGREPEIRRFGPEPQQAPPQLRSQRPPPSVFERPLPRVGTAVRTPEGEQILWVSDNCYVSLDSQSLTMREHHALKRGITTCQVGVGKRKARGDLFDPIKRPPRPDPLGAPQQEPGCGSRDDARSCAP